RRRKNETGYQEPTIFAVVNILLPKFFFALMIAPVTLGFSLLFFIPTVIYGVSMLLLSTVVLHLLNHIAGAKGGIEVTYRCVAYASIAFYTWLVPVPFFNLLLFTAAFCFLLFYAFVEINRLEPQKSLIIVSSTGLFILIFGSLLTIVTIWMLVRGFMIMMQYLM